MEWTRNTPVPYMHPPDKIADTVSFFPMSGKISRLFFFRIEQDNGLSTTSLMPRLLPHIEDWCEKEIKQSYGVCHIPKRFRVEPEFDHAVWFESESAAIIFKLKWL